MPARLCSADPVNATASCELLLVAATVQLEFRQPSPDPAPPWGSWGQAARKAKPQNPNLCYSGPIAWSTYFRIRSQCSPMWHHLVSMRGPQKQLELLFYILRSTTPDPR
jgi:hypothetical protein